MPGDFYVFVGVSSKQMPFYLRIYVDWNDDETEIVGRFDVTVPDELAVRFRDDVAYVWRSKFSERSSAEYYGSIMSQ